MKLAALMLLSLPLSAQTVLPDGTPVQLKLSQTISSANEQMGDLVGFTVVDDVKLGDKIVIPHDSQASAHVIEVQPKRWAGRGGKLSVMVDYVRLPDGEKLPLTATQRGQAGGHSTAMTGAMAATAVVFFPAAPLFLMMHGKEMVIPQGTVVDSFTAKAVPVAQ